MLDTQIRSCEDNAKMANPMPMEILANEKIGEEEETGKLQQKARKSKNILNWLKNSTTTTTTNSNATNLITNHPHNSHDSLEINSCQPSDQSTENHTTHQETATCLAHTGEPQPQPPTLIATTHQNGNISNDVTLLREFRGVQTLRHLWNKRITANKESAARAKIYKQQQQQQQHKQKQFTKSQSCLLSSGSRREDGEGEESPQPLHFELGFQAAPPLRAKSLHDCSGDFETDQDPLDLTVLELEKHLEKDNFYKYKTAEQATKLRELSEQHSSARRFSAGLLFSERFQWLKKPDIFTKRRASEVRSNLASEERSCKENFYSPFQERSGKENCYSHEGDSLLDIVINDFEPTTMLGDSMPAARCQNHTSTTTSNSNSTPMTSPHRLRPDSLHSSDSLASHNSSSTTTGRSSGVVRKNSSTRKYSFKTHQRSYHVRRKMHSGNHNKEHHGSSSSSSSSSTISLVAQLTQQFNERIQQDSSILEQVKRKNGILMTHKGHVFKVVEVDTHAPVGRTLSSHSKLSASLSNSSVSAVQRTIKKFENASRTSAKPKVPQKSSRVLEKSKELIYGKVGNTTKKEKEKAAMEVVKKSKQPPNTLALPKSLEMVKEETKTPLELEMEMERRMAAEKAALMQGERGDHNCQDGTGQGLKGYGNGEGEKGDSRDKAERELLDSPRGRSKDIKLENGETRNSPEREDKDLRKCQEQRDTTDCQGQGDSKENLEIRGQPMSSEPGIAGNRNENKSFKISPLKGWTKSENHTTSQESPSRENVESTEIPMKLGSQNSELYSKVRHKSSFVKDSSESKMFSETEIHQNRPTSPESPREDNEYSHRILEFKNSELYGKSYFAKDTLQTQDAKAPQVSGCENSQHSGQKESKNDQNLPTPPESPSEDNGKSPPIPKNLEFQNSSLYRAVGKQLCFSKDAEVAQEQRTSPTRQDDTNELSEESPLKENPKNSTNTDSESDPNNSPKPATIHMNQEFTPQISKKLEFQTSELYPKVRRQSSFAKEEKQRDIIIYIKQDFNKAPPDTETSALPEDSKTKEKISKKMENPKNENEKKTKVTRRPTTFYQDAHISKKPLQDNRRDILIYIKPGEQNSDELAKQTALGRNASFNSTEPKRLIKRANLSKEEFELAQEVKEKLSNLPRFANNKSIEEATPGGGKTAENSVQQRKLKTSQSVFYETLTTPGPKSPIAEQPEEGKKSKHKHSTFYEKLKIFTRKANHNKTNSTPTSPKAEEETKTLDSGTANEQPQPQSPTALNYTPMSSPRPKQKMITQVVEEVTYSQMYVPQSSGLLDALQQVEEKICSLSKTEGQTKEQQEGETLSEPPTGSDDFGQPLKPNTSFLHQTYSKVLTKPGGQIIQAVNVSLVNAIEGEQMELMEQKEIQQSQMAEKDENSPPEEKLSSPEPLYEPIEASTPTPRHQEEDIYQTVEELQKEIENYTETSKTTSSHLETLSKPLPPDAEEIYQTVEELQREVETTNETIGAQTPAKETNAKPELLDDYEVIGDPNLITTPTETPPKIPADFDGYEEYAPSVEPTAATTCNTMRKTTDELPDLPEPKRKINKPAPNLPLQPHICTKLPPIPTEIYAPSSNNNITLADDSHHYYADEEENIYDTIKGSDCYESIQPHNNNNNNAAPCNNLTKSSSNSSTTKNSDTQSISNCYESISHFKPPRPISISQHSGSSRGSTLTISSEHKTNSLYEDGSIGIIGMTSSSSSSLRYSSQRLYRSQHHREEDGGGATGANDSAGSSNYNSSMGRASDVSEEWMDISDNEENDETNWKPKPKYQIVCEKAHKSPSWSRRVREKRLHHQRKSRSYIEDDAIYCEVE
ncbi:uncharacterized protein LOC101894901 isoform X2 [Musca domestica]|uniref:Uncharacterized protein LOC101894901 isoform X2 n=1 Tax=Musca domestica TaxID=7370 RepID=A0ABM3V938_MUSDO|nr:uncharacterized protein LOC101894901 isoform X2 [Musca domestica]